MGLMFSEEIFFSTTESEWKEIKNVIENEIIEMPIYVLNYWLNDESKLLGLGSSNEHWTLSAESEDFFRLFPITPAFASCAGENGYFEEQYDYYDEDDEYLDSLPDGYDMLYARYFNGSGCDLGEKQSEIQADDFMSRDMLYEGTGELLAFKLFEMYKNEGRGATHRVTLNQDGDVEASGDNLFGECDTETWYDIVQISCGQFHTVGLKADGTVVACGSNVNGQCDMDGIEEKIVQVSCGRYHTALLTETGKVIIKGMLSDKPCPIRFPAEEKQQIQMENHFPMECKSYIHKDITGWEEMNKNVENLSEGERLFVRRTKTSFGYWNTRLYNSAGECVGKLDTCWHDGSLIDGIDPENLIVTAYNILPLSKRRKNAKYAKFDCTVDVADGTPMPFKTIVVDTWEDFYIPLSEDEHEFTDINEWPPVVKIISLFDGVAGLTADNKIYIDGCVYNTREDIENAFFRGEEMDEWL